MTTFYGSYEHSVDERGRVAVPARYRRAFVEGAVLRVGPEGCVEMYTTDGFEREVELRLGEQRSTRQREGRRIRRGFLPGAFDVELDRQGRILVPQALRQSSGLAERAVIVGCGDYIEMWDPAHWESEAALLAREERAEGALAAGGDA